MFLTFDCLREALAGCAFLRDGSKRLSGDPLRGVVGQRFQACRRNPRPYVAVGPDEVEGCGFHFVGPMGELVEIVEDGIGRLQVGVGGYDVTGNVGTRQRLQRFDDAGMGGFACAGECKKGPASE